MSLNEAYLQDLVKEIGKKNLFDSRNLGMKDFVAVVLMSGGSGYIDEHDFVLRNSKLDSDGHLTPKDIQYSYSPDYDNPYTTTFKAAMEAYDKYLCKDGTNPETGEEECY